VRIALATYGTRGDTQPIVCLGRALAERGHEVEVVAPRNEVGMAQAAGLRSKALPFDFQAMLRAEPAQRMLANGRINALLRWLADQEERYDSALRQTLMATAESVDLIVCTAALVPRCRAVAEAYGVALVPLHLAPPHSSRTYPAFALSPSRNLGPLNRASHRLFIYGWWRAQRGFLAALHSELGLPSPTYSRLWRDYSGQHPALLGYSPTLFAPPQDWPDRLHTVGCLRPSPELRAEIAESGLPVDLEDWLASGPPPVYLGFGSMPVLDDAAMLGTIRAALARLGVRGVLAAGWSELSAGGGDDSLYVVDQVDHDSLLPRCSAAVHAGGSGTTAASAAAGTPTLICSVWWDQPFWGARCRALGIGDTFPFTKLDVHRLVEGLRTVLRPEVAVRAKEVARRMADEDGVASAVAVIEQGRFERLERHRQGAFA
jgi:UDP:flavonoid glycosyltransferase YjiC (YdhE family)